MGGQVVRKPIGMREELQTSQSVPYLSGACTSDAGLTCITGAEGELARRRGRVE
jgi:hypothetical protein